MTPTEYRADAVVTLNVGDEPVLAVVVEVQLNTDARKRRTWPMYVTARCCSWCFARIRRWLPSEIRTGGAVDARARCRRGSGARVRALLAALEAIDHDRANRYTDLVLTVLPAAARVRLEELMTTMPREYQSDFARRYFNVRSTITSCADIDQLNTWVRRAATIERVEDLFD